MKIHLIRHTTPDISLSVCYGQADLNLKDSFEQEKQQILKKTQPHYDALFYSPLKRCSLLADAFSADTRQIENAIIEYNFGDWELQKWSDIKEHAFAKQWSQDFVTQAAPGGESLAQMQQRVQTFINWLIEQDYQSVALVTHSGVLRLFHAWVMEVPLHNIFKLELDFGAVMEVTYNKQQQRSQIKQL